MNRTRITSRDNPLVKQFRLAAAGSRRAPADLVFCEGLRALEEAAASPFEIVAVLAEDGFGANAREARLLDRWTRSRTRVHRVPPALLRITSDVLAPQGAVALSRVPFRRIADVPWPADALIVCADALQDPGNLGCLIRAAAAAAATGICCTPGTVSPRNPKCVRATAGMYFRVPVFENVTPDALVDRCRRSGIAIYRTDPRKGAHYREVDFRRGVLLVLGNEGRGSSVASWPPLPSIRIPLAPGIESLNVAAAGAVLLFEAFDQRSSRFAPASAAGKEA